jgi:hypothetical protein
MRRKREKLTYLLARNTAVQTGIRDFGLLFIRAGPIGTGGKYHSVDFNDIILPEHKKKLINYLITLIQQTNNQLIKQLNSTK